MDIMKDKDKSKLKDLLKISESQKKVGELVYALSHDDSLFAAVRKGLNSGEIDERALGNTVEVIISGYDTVDSAGNLVENTASIEEVFLEEASYDIASEKSELWDWVRENKREIEHHASFLADKDPLEGEMDMDMCTGDKERIVFKTVENAFSFDTDNKVFRVKVTVDIVK